MHKPNLSWTRKHPGLTPWLILTSALIFITAISLACNAPTSSEEDLKNTQISLNVQATQLAQQNQAETQSAQEAQNAEGQQLQQDLEATQTALVATQIAADVQATMNAQAATEAAQVTDTPMPSDTPQPTPTNEPPTAEPPTEAPPTEQPTTEAPVDVDELMKESNILLYENIVKEQLPRHILQALNNLGLSHNVVDTKDAVGNFKAQLLSGTDWDLVIVGVEARSSVQGEFFDYFNEQVNKGTGLILEHWNLDDIAGAKATSFLTNCGVKVQSDWYDPPLGSRSIWWLYGEHPVFHEPNEGMSLVNFNPYWGGDAGDLLKTIPGSGATMLAGTYAQEKSSYGVLAICHEDRVIIQTYSSHDYRQDDVVRLWENFIYNALRAHFEHELSQ